MTHQQNVVANPPFYSQWISANLIKNILSGEIDAADDPRWNESGAKTRQDYKRWSGHICGMACLRMVLKYAHDIDVPLFSLLSLCLKYGGYQVEGETIKGLFYFPFVKFINAEYGFDARVVEDISIQEVLPRLNDDCVFIASVHPTIRHPENKPPRKGGHLVLVHRFEPDTNRLVFHNPSGTDESNQANVMMDVQRFDMFFANRGIVIPVARDSHDLSRARG